MFIHESWKQAAKPHKLRGVSKPLNKVVCGMQLRCKCGATAQMVRAGTCLQFS